jgi:DNA-binding MarR family transcriptional regulator
MPAPTASPASSDRNVDQIAAALRVSIGLLVRRLRQVPVEGELTLSETSALARLDRGGPTTPGALAKQEQISPQSMGATVAALEARGLVRRRTDRHDGRRVVLSVSAAGAKVLRDRRAARAEQLAAALASGFSPDELGTLAEAAPLLERLAQLL